MNRRAAAVYRSDDSAGKVYRHLIREGIAPNRIDVRPTWHVHGLMPVVRSSAREGLVLGALLGVAIGLAVALRAVFAPEIAQSLVPGGSSLAAGALAGGLVGAMAGAFAGLFRSEPQQRRYAELVMKNGVVVSVDDVDPVQLKVVREVFVATRGVLLRAVDPPREQSAPRQAYG